jgi:hypothetical protein
MLPTIIQPFKELNVSNAQKCCDIEDPVCIIDNPSSTPKQI